MHTRHASTCPTMIWHLSRCVATWWSTTAAWTLQMLPGTGPWYCYKIWRRVHPKNGIPKRLRGWATARFATLKRPAAALEPPCRPWKWCRGNGRQRCSWCQAWAKNPQRLDNVSRWLMFCINKNMVDDLHLKKISHQFWDVPNPPKTSHFVAFGRGGQKPRTTQTTKNMRKRQTLKDALHFPGTSKSRGAIFNYNFPSEAGKVMDGVR